MQKAIDFENPISDTVSRPESPEEIHERLMQEAFNLKMRLLKEGYQVRVVEGTNTYWEATVKPRPSAEVLEELKRLKPYLIALHEEYIAELIEERAAIMSEGSLIDSAF